MTFDTSEAEAGRAVVTILGQSGSKYDELECALLTVKFLLPALALLPSGMRGAGRARIR